MTSKKQFDDHLAKRSTLILLFLVLLNSAEAEMTKTSSTIRQANLARAIRAVQACGLEIQRVEVSSNGSVSLITDQNTLAEISPFDEWKEKKNARSS
ncbi:hypothetical protein MKP08_10435 [Erythrobacter sp. LQ02-29]|uniref:hypothetical protein n=1 Tax=Erythrobacter sp. LQ02-29 TaxID=2920384 RepID=UPI001F4EEDE1|nr:hypothetical protein [Erythrobacter sp. LQ02-29]MCP9223167.1 hypothetical protein [Erythrobacter sp. LQ02-29]